MTTAQEQERSARTWLFILFMLLVVLCTMGIVSFVSITVWELWMHPD